MTPAILTLPVTRGLPLAIELDLCSDDLGAVPVDLTGCSLAAAIRPAAAALPKVELHCIITDAVMGKLTLSLDQAATALLTSDPHLWDLVVTDASGVPVPVLTGRVEISENATT